MSGSDFIMTMAILVGILIGVCFILPVMGALISKKKLQSDDSLPELTYVGKIISLSQQNLGMFVTDAVVLEAADGTRKRLRNVQTQNIILQEGDSGTFTVRGQTIYAFKKNVNITSEDKS